MVRRYLDFSVGIESTAGGGHIVRAFSHRAEAESVTEFPFGPGELSGILEPLMEGSSPEARPDPTKLGGALFAALFPGPVGELYSSEWSAAMKAGDGLRIRLHLRPGNPELAWLTRVPWELIFDERAGGFPCLNPLTPLVRHIDLPRPVERVPFRPPIRVLVAAANPSSEPRLALQSEQERIEAARKGRKRVEVKVLEDTSPEELRRELTRGRYQIVHFMGHALMSANDGSLMFSTAEGFPRRVTGEEMSHLVQGAPAAQLVILNACHSAASPGGQGAGLLTGVAGALVRGGQPAVLGMQFAISDRAALKFSEILYERLAEGDPIEAAVTEARLAIYFANPNSTHWVAPVLFLRGADDRLEAKTMNEKQERPVKKSPTQTVEIKAKNIHAKNADLTALDSDGAAKLPNHSGKVLVNGDTLQIDGELNISAIRVSKSSRPRRG